MYCNAVLKVIKCISKLLFKKFETCEESATPLEIPNPPAYVFDSSLRWVSVY
jgi:hypothetical protein